MVVLRPRPDPSPAARSPATRSIGSARAAFSRIETVKDRHRPPRIVPATLAATVVAPRRLGSRVYAARPAVLLSPRPEAAGPGSGGLTLASHRL